MKQSGELDTKSKLNATESQKEYVTVDTEVDPGEKRRITLTAKEKSELFIEGVVTIVLLLLLNLSVVIILEQVIQTNSQFRDGIWQIKNGLTFGFGYHLWSWQNIFIMLMLLFDGLVTYWRLIRRYHQMQMRHVISELHHIADGHLGHRIDFKVNRELQHVIDSINALVDSTMTSLEEERKIEKSKDELITNVSHDIRTPLTSIIGYLGLIVNHQYHDDAEVSKYSKIAYGKSQQMKALVDDLFEYAKVQQTSSKLNLSTFDLHQMLEQVAASFELEADKHEVELEVQTRPDPLIMKADAEKLGRIFNNLVTNALKYGVDAKTIYLSGKQMGDRVEIRVANDGEQIPQKSLDSIFERFYRVETSRSKETGGTGLGLAIVRSIVELHEGEIRAESNEELTSFIITLPIHILEPNKENQQAEQD